MRYVRLVPENDRPILVRPRPRPSPLQALHPLSLCFASPPAPPPGVYVIPLFSSLSSLAATYAPRNVPRYGRCPRKWTDRPRSRRVSGFSASETDVSRVIPRTRYIPPYSIDRSIGPTEGCAKFRRRAGEKGQTRLEFHRPILMQQLNARPKSFRAETDGIGIFSALARAHT